MRSLPSWLPVLAGLVAGALTIALLPSASLFTAATHSGLATASPAEPGARYACPMMDFIGDRPGECPVCGMQMTKVTAGELTAEQTRRMGVETTILRAGPAVATIRAYGTAEYDNRHTKLVIPRVAGRIVARHEATYGCCEIVAAGAPVIDVYSETVIAAQAELQAARKLIGPRQLRNAHTTDCYPVELLIQPHAAAILRREIGYVVGRVAGEHGRLVAARLQTGGQFVYQMRGAADLRRKVDGDEQNLHGDQGFRMFCPS